MRYFRFFICLSTIFICLIGCKTPVYYPNVINTPHFEQAKEAEVFVGVSPNGIDVQGAYAINDDMAVLANVNGNSMEREAELLSYTSIEDLYKSHFFGEVGVGKWHDFNDNKSIGCTVGYGIGRTRLLTGFDFRDVRINRVFIQPYYGVVNSFFEFYLSSRIAFVDVGGKSNLFLEPSMTFKVGFNKLKFFTQIGIVNQNNAISERQNNIPTQGLLFTLGLSYKFKKEQKD